MADITPKDLVDILQDRDLSASYDELQKAFRADQHGAMKNWMNEHLASEVLLTKEELALWNALQKSGEVESLTAGLEFSTLRAQEEQDFRNAIEELKKSTAAIEKQSNTLRLQQEAVASLVRNNQQNDDARAVANATQHRQWNTENGQSNTVVDELLQTLQFRISELDTQNKTTSAFLSQAAAEILRADDKLILSLQKLSAELETGNSDDGDKAERIRDLCARLIKHTVEGVRTRLDRVYLEAGGKSSQDDQTSRRNDLEVDALQGELESLYSEILPVAQMSAEQQFLQPAIRAISAQDSQGKDRSMKAIEYISTCLSFLIKRLNTFAAQAEDHQRYQMAMGHVITIIKGEINVARQEELTKHIKTGSPARRKHPKPVSPVRPRSTRRRSSAASFEEDLAPGQQILRNLGVSIPDAPVNEKGIATALLEALTDRTNKLHGHAQNLQQSEEMAIASHLHDSYITLQLLRDSILSETKLNSVRLVDEEIEEAIALMEKEVEDLKRDLDVIDVEKLKERNVNKDALVERWGR